MGALAWLMNLDFAAGGGAVSGGGAPRRKWHSPEIENLLAAQTLAATLWANGLISEQKRDEMLDRVNTNLKKAGYGKRFPEQPERRNYWKGKSRGKR